MKVNLTVLALTDRGASVTASSDTGANFWLPRAGPHVGWSQPPEVGAKVSATIPRWLASKHKQLTPLRGQTSLAFNPTPGLDPVKSEGAIPMAYDQNERSPQGRGALFINRQKQQPNHPDRRGDLTLPAGYVLTLANGTTLTLPADAKLEVVGWLKDTKSGEKYLSLSAKPFVERQQREVPTNSSVGATVRDDRAPSQSPPRDWSRQPDQDIPF
jgi:hypothetical protein